MSVVRLLCSVPALIILFRQYLHCACMYMYMYTASVLILLYLAVCIIMCLLIDYMSVLTVFVHYQYLEIKRLCIKLFMHYLCFRLCLHLDCDSI